MLKPIAGISQHRSLHPSRSIRSFDPGNSPNQALKLPAFQGTRKFRGSVSASDSSDYFELTVTRPSSLSVGLTRLRSSGVGLNLELLDRSQKSLGPVIMTMDLPPSLFSGNVNRLQPGQYFVRVAYAPNYSFPGATAGEAKYRMRIDLQPT